MKPALINPGLLQDLQNRAAELKELGERYILIADETVGKLHASAWCEKMIKAGLLIELFTLPAGEEFKTRQMKEELEDRLLDAHVGRYSVLLAMGGGVICDLVGFLASTYCRGVGLVLIPTTLLAMCDAAIGGKTGVNMPKAKNRIGSFYPADAVWVDSDCLKTLPVEQRREGLVEMIKHALICDETGYAFLEEHLERILDLEPLSLEKALSRSIAIKQEIVHQDLKEANHRAILNFGHTVGHAIEAASGYCISHGAAVAIGLKIEARLSKKFAGLSQPEVDRIDRLLERVGLGFIEDGTFDSVHLIAAMQHDKKHRQGSICSVLLEAIGKPYHKNGQFTHPIPDSQMMTEIESYTHYSPNSRFEL